MSSLLCQAINSKAVDINGIFIQLNDRDKLNVEREAFAKKGGWYILAFELAALKGSIYPSAEIMPGVKEAIVRLEEIQAFLIENGFDIHAKNADGRSAIERTKRSHLADAGQVLEYLTKITAEAERSGKKAPVAADVSTPAKVSRSSAFYDASSVSPETNGGPKADGELGIVTSR
ncbi:MAG: hypothetical protein Q7V63_01300 [Gammaproteobacteria bacterium]|nr:hypothetical protein [Gammaproteobacteria bacterium]